jgi:ADP-ribose pyrophosphatase YjhB (NUDIX family)
MTERRPLSVRDRAYAVAIRVYCRLPGGMKRRIVRVAAPTYTLGAVTLVLDVSGATGDGLIPDGSRLLLQRQPPGWGWSLPGGLIERGEKPRDCAARELREESGIRLDAEVLRPAVPNAVVHPRGQWVDTVFVAHIDPAAHPIAVDHVEVDEAAWYPLAELPRLTLATARLLAVYGIGPLADYDGDVDLAVPPE